MKDFLWIVAVVAVLGTGFFGMGKLGDFMDKNRADRQDLSRQKHRG